MHSSSILAVFTSILALAVAAPAAPVETRDTHHSDVLITFADGTTQAIQLITGTPRIIINEKGQQGALLTSLKVSTQDATVDFKTITCWAYAKTDATQPIWNGAFNLAYPAWFQYPVQVGSVLCEFV